MSRRVTGWTALLAASVLGTACQDPLTPSTVAASAGPRTSVAAAEDVPVRGGGTKWPRWSEMPDSVLWQAASQRDSVFVVGLKKPGARRGVWRNRVLIEAADLRGVRTAIASRLGVRVVADSFHLPKVHVKVASQAALAVLRRLPFVDYLEPTASDISFMSDPGGCSQNAWTGYSPTHEGEIVPEGWYRSGVIDAWLYSTGAGVKIGLTDTGVPSDGDFEPVRFRGTEQYPRTIEHASQPWVIADQPSCSHGVRMAGLIAAPKNGSGTVGVAWRSSLASYYHDIDVEPHHPVAAQGIHDVATRGSKVIVMAWGTKWYHDDIADEIRAHYHGDDVFFVGAAGTADKTGVSGYVSNNNVIFPAEMEEVFAVSGSTLGGSRPADNFYGDELDGIMYTDVPTTGFGTPNAILQMQGSSAATAQAGGIAALVRSRYPYMNRYDVFARLRSTAGAQCGLPDAWRPNMLLNALAAVGGVCGKFIAGPSTVYFNGPNDPPRIVEFVERATSDGPPLQIAWPGGQSGEVARYEIRPWVAGSSYVHAVFVTVTDTRTGVSRQFQHNVTVQTGGTASCPDPYDHSCYY